MAGQRGTSGPRRAGGGAEPPRALALSCRLPTVRPGGGTCISHCRDRIRRDLPLRPACLRTLATLGHRSSQSGSSLAVVPHCPSASEPVRPDGGDPGPARSACCSTGSSVPCTAPGPAAGLPRGSPGSGADLPSAFWWPALPEMAPPWVAAPPRCPRAEPAPEAG